MAIYTVHVPGGLNDPALRADKAALVRDGFSFGAFLYGPLYLLAHRAYLAAAAWLAAVVAIGAVAHTLRLPGAAEVALAVVIMLFTGLEASSIRRLVLHRRGLDLAGVVSGRSLEEGEAAYFRATLAGRDSVPASGVARASRPAASGVIGLFPDPGA